MDRTLLWFSSSLLIKLCQCIQNGVARIHTVISRQLRVVLSLDRPFALSISEPLQSCRTGTTSITRPLGCMEQVFLQARGLYGHTDMFLIATLDCTNNTISDEHVVLACALLRIRHPLLASHVSNTDLSPEFVYTPPLTEVCAMEEARVQVEFGTFADRDQAVLLLRERWTSVDPLDTLDPAIGVCRVFWSKNVSGRAGKYVLGFYGCHSVVDGVGILCVARQFVEDLAAPDLAQAELAGHFSDHVPFARLPEPMENLFPDPTATSDPAEQAKGEEIYDNLMGMPTMQMGGLVPDGSADTFKARIIRHTWSDSDTAKIIRACKAHGVTVTQLVSAIMAIAAAPPHGGIFEDCHFLHSRPLPCSDYYCFKLHMAIDLSRRSQMSSSEKAVYEAVLRAAGYAIFVAVPRFKMPDHEGAVNEAWSIARQCKQSHDVDSAVQPRLPLLSSLGDCSKQLPSRFVMTSAPAESVLGKHHTLRRGEIIVSDMMISGRMLPDAMALHLWTYGSHLNVQLTHNSSYTSTILMDRYFRRVIEMVTMLGLSVEGDGH
ncbi:hypothetical protein AcV7_002209 [Taiwanofungus camphoratus]|nr:hypothetical protein AcV7_002209 [Antrodia cinnamomea]